MSKSHPPSGSTNRDRTSDRPLTQVVETDLDSPSTRTGLRSSVVIAAYNAERSLAETLDSLEVQTLRPHEIIVVDDGSTDRTSEIANDHAVDVTLIRTPNRGMCAARNEAIEASSGELICILDADDLWHPNYVERMTSMMERHPEAGSGFSRYRAWQSPTQKPAAWEERVDGGHHLHDLDSFLSIGRSGLPVLPSFHVTRREVLRRLGPRPFREDQVQGEAAFLFALLGAVAPVVEHVAPLGRYRMHSEAMTGDEMDAARRIEPCIDDLRSAAGGGLGLELELDAGSRRSIDRHACDWYRRCGRRLGGGGSTGEGRRQLIKAARLGDRKAALMVAASFLPGISERIWIRAWRPKAARRDPAVGNSEESGVDRIGSESSDERITGGTSPNGPLER